MNDECRPRFYGRAVLLWVEAKRARVGVGHVAPHKEFGLKGRVATAPMVRFEHEEHETTRGQAEAKRVATIGSKGLGSGAAGNVGAAGGGGSMGLSPSGDDNPSAYVWQPPPEALSSCNMERFRKRVGEASMASLRQRAAREPDWFWRHVCADLGIEFDAPPQAFYTPTDDETRPLWCAGGQMNIVTSCLDKWVNQGRGAARALVYESESGQRESVTYAALLQRVQAVSAYLQELGVQPGSVVAILMPMNVSAVVALLAVARCGAVALPLFSGFGRSAISVRLQESRACALLCSASVQRRGREVSLLATALESLGDCPTVRHVVVDSGTSAFTAPQDAPGWLSWHTWEQALSYPAGAGSARALVVSSEHPILLMFTSGTTGRPKGAVHSHCGFPVKAAQDMRHAMDLGPSDTLHWVSDLGWMMGPWAIFGSLLGGMTLALYDGAPDFPDPLRLLRFVHESSVTFLGLSPPLARMLRNSGRGRADFAPLTKGLRAIGSTGSPWDRESWLWTFETLLGATRPIINYSGGTEVSGGILSGDWLTPLKPCSFGGPVLGMDADVWSTDEAEGKPVRGRPGELVVRNHWIGMTRGFWDQDPRYRSTYWERFPGVWTHGDLAIVDEDGLWFLVGRSDDTIKVAGKRLGPAEVETIVNSCEGVRESAAIGVTDEVKGEALVVFCVASDEYFSKVALREPLRTQIQNAVAKELGKPLMPREVWFVASLPRTRNAKTMHRLIRAVYEGREPGDLSALENLEALEHLRTRS